MDVLEIFFFTLNPINITKVEHAVHCSDSIDTT